MLKNDFTNPAGAIEDCALGVAVLLLNAKAREYYLLYEELKANYGHLWNSSGFAWNLKTHQSAGYPLVLGLREQSCFGLPLKLGVMAPGTDFDFFSEETADNFGAHCQHCHWCFTHWKDYVIPGFEKWSVVRMHSLQKATEQRRFTACYHGADSDALAIYKYANATATGISTWIPAGLYWTLYWTPRDFTGPLSCLILFSESWVSVAAACWSQVRNDLQSFNGRANWSIGYRFGRITETWMSCCGTP
eukprot:Skav235735  [mRNA]  locus=scaffold1686:133569:139547:- [translate_table: standard]